MWSASERLQGSSVSDIILGREESAAFGWLKKWLPFMTVGKFLLGVL